MLEDQKLKNFMDSLASKSPTPGGGSVAALTGAMSAALLSMVSNLTLGKKKYLDVEEDIKKLLKQSETLRDDLEKLIERDVEAFNQFMSVMKMPRETEKQKEDRSIKMQESLLNAANVPLEIANKCLNVLDICQEIARKGNINVISDAGVGAILAEAALDSALLNVRINTNMVKEDKKKEYFMSEIHRITNLAKGKKESTVKIVMDKT